MDELAINEENRKIKISTLTVKTALILGCSGQDGSLISLSLIRKGYKVIGLSRKANIENRNLKKLGIENDVQIKIGDITNFSNLKRLIEEIQPNEIYNLAGQSSVGRSFSDPLETTESIVNGSQNLLEAARIINFKGNIFFAGSSEIFGETEKRAEINSIQNPISPYGIAKQTSFNLVKLYREIYKIKCVTGVLFNHESTLRSPEFVTQKIISGAIKCSRDKSLKINIGDVDVARDWGWAQEYVEAMQLINNASVLKDQIVCTGRLTKLRDFIEITFRKVNLDWRNHIVNDTKLYRKTDIRNSYGNPDALRKDLGWSSQISLDEIIDNLIKSQLNNE